MDYFSKTPDVLKLPNDLAIFSFTYGFAAYLNVQFPWGKKSAYPLHHTRVLGLSVTISALGGQGRDCRNRRRNSFLIHYFKQDRKGGLWLSWK